MAYALYIIGFLVVIAGLVLAATALGVPQTWIVIGLVIVVGIALMATAANLERRSGGSGLGD